MTIFQHTIDKVLSGEKTATSRLWKDDYVFSWSDYEKPNQIVLSQKAWEKGKIRKLYYVGQILSVQPNRGAKGIAKIRVMELAKRDVRLFWPEDIRNEGFKRRNEFLQVWISMHDKQVWRDTLNKTGVDYKHAVDQRPAALYQALVIRFELVTVAELAK
jgi:hypothetical protein